MLKIILASWVGCCKINLKLMDQMIELQKIVEIEEQFCAAYVKI